MFLAAIIILFQSISQSFCTLNYHHNHSTLYPTYHSWTSLRELRAAVVMIRLWHISYGLSSRVYILKMMKTGKKSPKKLTAIVKIIDPTFMSSDRD